MPYACDSQRSRFWFCQLCEGKFGHTGPVLSSLTRTLYSSVGTRVTLYMTTPCSLSVQWPPDVWLSYVMYILQHVHWWSMESFEHWAVQWNTESCSWWEDCYQGSGDIRSWNGSWVWTRYWKNVWMVLLLSRVEIMLVSLFTLTRGWRGDSKNNFDPNLVLPVQCHLYEHVVSSTELRSACIRSCVVSPPKVAVPYLAIERLAAAER